MRDVTGPEYFRDESNRRIALHEARIRASYRSGDKGDEALARSELKKAESDLNKAEKRLLSHLCRTARHDLHAISAGEETPADVLRRLFPKVTEGQASGFLAVARIMGAHK